MGLEGGRKAGDWGRVCVGRARQRVTFKGLGVGETSLDSLGCCVPRALPALPWVSSRA